MVPGICWGETGFGGASAGRLAALPGKKALILRAADQPRSLLPSTGGTALALSLPCTRCRRADATPRPTVATHCEAAPWSIVETSARHSALRVSHRALSAHFDTLSAQLGASPHAAEARLLEHGCCLQVKCGLEHVPDPRASTAPHSDTCCTWHRMWICTAAQSAILRIDIDESNRYYLCLAIGDRVSVQFHPSKKLLVRSTQ